MLTLPADRLVAGPAAIITLLGSHTFMLRELRLVAYRAFCLTSTLLVLEGNSESDDRTEGNPEIVVRPVVEVHLIAHFESESDWSQGRFETSCRIECRVQAGSSQPEHRTDQATVGQQTRAEPEIDEACLQRCEGA